MSILKFIIVSTMIIVSTQIEQTCQVCADSHPENYICKTKSKRLLKGHGHSHGSSGNSGSSSFHHDHKKKKHVPIFVECCDPYSTDEKCDKSKHKCSDVFSVDQAKYFWFCPEVTVSKCGYNGNYKDFEFYASNNDRNFTFTGKNVCSYKVMNPPGGYRNGSVYLTIEKVSKTKVYLSSDDLNF